MKKTLNEKISIGDRVVYPAYGVGRILERQEMTILDKKQAVFVIVFDAHDFRIMVPEERIEVSGLRRLVSPEKVQEALDALKKRSRQKSMIWARYADELERRIVSGDLVKIASVIRDLAAHDNDSNYSARVLYDKALNRLAAEAAAVLEKDHAEMIACIESRVPQNNMRQGFVSA